MLFQLVKMIKSNKSLNNIGNLVVVLDKLIKMINLREPRSRLQVEQGVNSYINNRGVMRLRL